MPFLQYICVVLMGSLVMKQPIVESSSFHLFVRRAISAAIATHVLFLLLFVFLKVPVLIATNLGSLPLYLVSLWLLRSRSFKAIAALVWVDLIAHSLISVSVLGWQSGFHFYLLLLVPMSFLNISKYRDKRIFQITAILLTYLLLDYYSYGRPVIIELPSTFSMLIRYINVVICFIGLSYQLYGYRSLLQQEYRLPTSESASTDQLTGLDNRSAILSKIDEIFSSSPYARQPMALIIADVDLFKQLNEQYGHHVGNMVLVHVAQILHDSVRHNDRASRWGGGEFLILLPGGSLVSAEQIAKRVQRKLFSTPLLADGKSLSISLTFGVAELLPDENFNQCLIRADSALQQGKLNGGNQIELASVDSVTPSPA